ncbi:L,D-transpeptidase family protein [Sphingomicrobium astaxanthinifaciens]|uniref:L,D-transpeptidase family protein n=1 Tax=Sphingomicrobium astaxanthinifaciens TaxID=1227949 RepID=UPI001FCCC0C1|nr:L,D-transpeptidase family protein [Sphingomicrobium astaxanthinifaciens]MCJ7421865.1 L,D-transpeptidase family protein [Sphingomicrobium astaxanthinifaciens]
MTFSRVALVGLAVLLPATPLAAQPASDRFEIAPPEGVFADKRQEATLEAQVLLVRAGHSPGVIDGYPGGNTSRALRAFQRAQGLEVTGSADSATMEALRKAAADAPLLERYTIEAASSEFSTPADGMAEQAETGRVGYGSLGEKLAEQFGMSEGLLRALNPGGLSQGTEIIVVAADMGDLPAVERVEIDGEDNEVRAYDADGTLVASFPATVGSDEFPSPSGTMEVAALAPEANYTFDPSDQEWGGDETLVIPAGPNNPIGGIWIDLGKDGYGIHGSPDPALIGKTSSHGCVRLTNWDARTLMNAVSPGTVVAFQ